MSVWHTKQAVRAVRGGGVIAYPTEAVWGLGCDPWNRQAVTKLLRLKQRPVEKGLILVASELSQLGALLDNLTDSERSLISAQYTHPVTWLVPDPDDIIPIWVKGLHSEVAVRVSTHSGVRELCKYYDGLLISTSANRSSEEPARSVSEIRKAFGRELDFVLPGQLGGASKPSEIRALRSGKVIRSG